MKRDTTIIAAMLLAWASGMVLFFTADPSPQICAGLALIMASTIISRVT